ncbi:MAG TPA: LCP family protein [Candidatus Gallacutalibacter stercoravium]|nr:LCP family protein [Candidatus Gallacutalibacter stercoravium]
MDRDIYSCSTGPKGLKHNRYGKKKHRGIKAFFLTLGLLIVITLVAGFILLFTMLNQIERKPFEDFNTQEAIDAAGAVDPGDSLGLTLGSGDIRSEDGITNILLIGSDSRNAETGRSDTMLLLSIDEQHHKLKMTSFLRDLYVIIPGQQNNRLNAAYAYGGAGLLARTIEENFRIHIDHYVEVDFASFTSLIDTVGGVDIELTQAEADELNSQANAQLFSAGVQHLDGEWALNYARIRKIDSDFGRTQRQRNVISALIAQFQSAGIVETFQTVQAVLPMLCTDMDNWELIRLMVSLPSIKNYPVSQMAVPITGGYQDMTIREMMVLVPDIEANKQAIWDFIYED